MPELKVFGDPSEEEVVFSVDGEDAYRFGLDEYRMWRGVISVNDESATIDTSFYITNPYGWQIVCASKSPWDYKELVSYNDSYDSDEDYYLVFQVPRGDVEVVEKGYYE